MGREQENIILAKYGLFIGHSQATTSGITWHTTRVGPVPVHSLPTPVGWQTSAPAEPPLALETGDAQGLVIDTTMHWPGWRKQIPSLHQKAKNWRFGKIILKFLRFFTSFETWACELWVMGSVAKQFPSLTKTIGIQRGKYCPPTILLISHSYSLAAAIRPGSTLPWPCQHIPEVAFILGVPRGRWLHTNCVSTFLLYCCIKWIN